MHLVDLSPLARLRALEPVRICHLGWQSRASVSLQGPCSPDVSEWMKLIRTGW